MPAAGGLVTGVLHLTQAGNQSWLPELGPDLSPLRVELDLQQPDSVHLKLNTVGAGRWEVPERLFNPATDGEHTSASTAACSRVAHGEVQLVWDAGAASAPAARQYEVKYRDNPFEVTFRTHHGIQSTCSCLLWYLFKHACTSTSSDLPLWRSLNWYVCDQGRGLTRRCSAWHTTCV